MAKKIIKKKSKPVKKSAAKKAAVKKPVKKAVKKIIKKVTAKKAAPAKKVIKKAAVPAAKPAAKAKPVVSASEELTKEEIKEIRKHLIELRDDAMARLKDKKDTEMPEDASYGDPIDIATTSLDKEILFEQTDNSQTTIEQIESALRKIDKGIYGKCEYCRATLPKKRIKALPFARYCVNCQSSREVGS